ncbi:MAG: hypothetical protein IKO12_09790 [Bacteroidaceae bacterium]|nr:hypothetical protein [Bacteroidaceae bacterium]
MKRLLFALFLLVGTTAKAQVDNYCLEFSPSGIVNLGNMSALPSAEDDYTLQFWFCPSAWTPKAALVRSNTFSIKLGNDHSLVFNDGVNHFAITDSRIGQGKWCHVTMRANKAGNQTSVTLNNAKTFTHGQYLSLPARQHSLWLGGEFSGRMDEIRLWDTLLPTDYESFYNNTINKLHPQWASLVGYWKVDQERCANVVNFRYETVQGTEATNGLHGTMSAAGVQKVKYADNPQMKYRIHMAYDNLEHTFRRAYDSDHYGCLSNFIGMLGISTDKNGNAWFNAAVQHGTVSDGAEYLESFGKSSNKRTGLLHLATEAATLTLPQNVIPADATNFTLEFWLSIDEWKEGAKVLSKRVDDKNFIEITLGETNADGASGRIYLQHNGGTKKGLSAWNGTGMVSVFRTGTYWYFFSLTQDDFPMLEGNPIGLGAAPMVLGEGLKCKLDNVATWNITRTEQQIVSDRKSPEMPAPGVSIDAWSFYNKIGFYRFEKPANLGFDSYSLPGYLDYMRNTAGNLRGQRWVVTAIQPSDGSLNTAVGSDANRKRMAKALAACANEEGIDGIDIDFEWMYNESGWRNIGLMLKELRPLLQKGKIISVSMHNVTYNFPRDLMQYVDFFNIQQYGPQATHSYYSTFVNNVNNIINWGVPREKLLPSYATISNNGGGAGTIGYNWNAGNIADNQDEFVYNGSNYVMNSLNQVVERTRYARDNDLAGIMYWDMCNDLASNNDRSMARRCSYVINANVHPLIETVAASRQAAAPEQDTKGPVATPDPEDQGGIMEEPVGIKTMEELIANRKALNIINTKGLGILYSNPAQTNLWLGESSHAAMSQQVDHDSEDASWVIMQKNDKWYMYNAGRKEFAKLPEFVSGSKPASFSAEPLPVEITCDGQGVFCFRLEGQTHEKAWLCASPQLSGTPVCDWTNTDNGSTWQLVTVPMADAQHAYATANAMVDFAADKEGFDIANTVSSLSEVANDQAYTIKNSSGLGVIYSNPNQSNVWLGESSNETFAAAVNRFSENSMWLLIEHAGQHLLYNIGRKQFLCIPAFDVVSQPCTFQDEPFGLEVAQQANGFSFRRQGSQDEKGFMCAAPQNAAKPVAQWTVTDSGCQWQLVKVPGYDTNSALAEAMEKIITVGVNPITPIVPRRTEGIYTLSGQRLNRAPQHGIFIHNGKKVMR